MAFTPNTRVYLLDTPLDNTYKNELLFSSKTEQTNYFLSCIKHEFSGVTYQRKNNVMRVEAHIDTLWDSNYCMYQNTNFTNKWFYAFINKIEYVSERATDIYIETDVYQTWLFDVTIKPSFVVREHVSDDTIGKHLVDEQLEHGDYIMEDYNKLNRLGANWNILAVSDNSPLGNNARIGNLYGNVVTGMTYFPFPNDASGIAWLKDTLQTYDEAGKPDAIQMIFTVPRIIIESTLDNPAWSLGLPIFSGDVYGVDEFGLTTKRLQNLNGYVPKNNKMYTHPYKFLYVSNNTGGSAVYRYEDFDDSIMQFSIFGSVCPNPSVMLAPRNYKGYGLKKEYGLILQGFPLCSWASDTYTAWFAQNGASVGVALAGSAVAIVGGVAMGNVAAVAGGALGVFSQMAQISKAAIQPDQAKGQSSGGTLQFGTNDLDYYYAHMSIKAEFAKRIDDYFTMYGYKVNTLKIPETRSRTNWNYIQTIDVNLDGAIPTDDMSRLKKVYDEGVTLWHTTSGFLNYSLDNSIR